jgi:hypothetical protein
VLLKTTPLARQLLVLHLRQTRLPTFFLITLIIAGVDRVVIGSISDFIVFGVSAAPQSAALANPFA